MNLEGRRSPGEMEGGNSLESLLGEIMKATRDKRDVKGIFDEASEKYGSEVVLRAVLAEMEISKKEIEVIVADYLAEKNAQAVPEDESLIQKILSDTAEKKRILSIAGELSEGNKINRLKNEVSSFFANNGIFNEKVEYYGQDGSMQIEFKIEFTGSEREKFVDEILKILKREYKVGKVIALDYLGKEVLAKKI